MKDIKSLFYGFLVILGLGLGVSACNSGNSNVQLPNAGPTPTPTPIPTPVVTPTPVPTGQAAAVVPLPPSGTATSVPLPVPTNGVMGTSTVAIPATATIPAGTVTTTIVTTGSVPAGLPQTFSYARSVQGTRGTAAIGSPPLATYQYNFSKSVSLAGGTISLSASFAPGVISGNQTALGATSDGVNWYYNTIPCTMSFNGSTGYTTVTCSFTGSYTLVANQNFGFAIYLQ